MRQLSTRPISGVLRRVLSRSAVVVLLVACSKSAGDSAVVAEGQDKASELATAVAKLVLSKLPS